MSTEISQGVSDDLINGTIQWVKNNYDIDDEAPDRAVEHAYDVSFPKRLEWMQWLPNGIYLNWSAFSEHERCLMISVAFHLNWKHTH